MPFYLFFFVDFPRVIAAGRHFLEKKQFWHWFLIFINWIEVVMVDWTLIFTAAISTAAMTKFSVFRSSEKKKKLYYQRLFYCHYSLTYKLSDKLILNVKFIIFLSFFIFYLNKWIATLRQKFWLRVRMWKISSEPCGLFVLFPSFCTFFFPSLFYFTAQVVKKEVFFQVVISHSWLFVFFWRRGHVFCVSSRKIRHGHFGQWMSRCAAVSGHFWVFIIQ